MDIIEHCKTIKRLPFDMNSNEWTDFPASNCYEYLLNFPNDKPNQLIVGATIGKSFQPYWTKEMFLRVLREELQKFGFTMDETNFQSETPPNSMKFFIARSICGDYHFYRLNSNGKWSHKFRFAEPTTLDFDEREIISPEEVCKTDENYGYYLLGIVKT